jgi:hypothetical protein
MLETQRTIEASAAMLRRANGALDDLLAALRLCEIGPRRSLNSRAGA